MKKAYNEETLLGPQSILIGDGIPNGRRYYKKGCIIVNVGEKRVEEPIYICVEDGCPGKWVALQGKMVLSNDDFHIEDVEESLDKVISSLKNFKENVFNKPNGSEIESNVEYIAVELPNNEEFIKAEKKLLANGEEIQLDAKMSVGNNNFAHYNQYEFEGNICRVSLPTLIVSEQPFTVVADGFENVNFEIKIPDLKEAQGVVYKTATSNKGEFELEKIADGEYNVILNKSIPIPSWSNAGQILMVIDVLNNGNSVVKDDTLFITSKKLEDIHSLGLSGADQMLMFGEEVKRPVLGFYLPVFDYAYDYEYKVVLLGEEYKFVKVVLHVPANI